MIFHTRIRTIISLFFLAVCATVPLHAGAYTQNFSSGTIGSQTLGDGSTISSSAGSSTTAVRIWAQGNQALQLMGTLGGNSGSWKIPDLDLNKEIQSFDATFTAGTYRSTAGATPGAGWSLNFGAIPTGDGAGDGGFVMPSGLVVAWDLFNNGGSDNPSIEVFCNQVSVGNFPSATLSDSPVPDGGTFTLTNPVTGGTTAPIAALATAATVQAEMRLVAGWEAVTVTGNAGGTWTVDHGVVGAYADPSSDPSGVLPANSSLTVTNPQNGTATLNERWTLTQRAFRGRAVVIHWDYDGLDVSVNGAAIFTNLPTPGFVPAVGHKFAFSARTESSNTMNFFLDDVTLATTQLQPVETGGPVISEFMAENGDTLEDEDTDSSDWVEIYNGQNIVANLGGWYLTNNAANKTMWQFPTVTIPAYSYKVIWASGKNRTVATGQLHTNFTLQKEGGYLALVRPDGTTIATQFTYGNQFEDVSYGEKGPVRTLGYILPSTPGAKANYSNAQAPGGPAEDVIWSRTGGLITGSTTVSIAPPAEPGAVVRYTTNNTEPGEASPLYNPASPPAAFTFSTTTTLRARIYAPGKLPGDVSSRTFLLIDSTLTNYNGSGQPFSTNVPIVVLESFGVPVDSYTATTAREYRLTYAVVIAPNPATGRATITDPPDFQGRCGTHVRGESSAGFPQRQYAWELWDNNNQDNGASILGMPSNSDWILYAPWSDKSLMRDVLTFGTMRKLRTDYLAARTRFCEVIFNQTAGAAVGYGASYKGLYAIKEKLKVGKDRVDIAKLNSLTAAAPAVTGGYIFRKDKVDPDSTGWTSATFSIPLLSYDPDLLTAPQLASLQGYVNSFEAVLNGANFTNPTTGYAAWMEADTFIDAQWFVEWTKQVDGYVFSTYFHKDRSGKLRAGPIWDFNIAIGNANYATGDAPTGWLYDTAGTATGAGQLWYPRLHADPWYRLRHFDRYWEMRRGLLATSAILGDIDANATYLLNGSATAVTNSMAPLPPTQENAVMRHYRLFPRLGLYDWPNAAGFASRTTYQSEVSYMKTWLTTRLNWLDDQNFTGSVIYRPPNFSLNGGNVNAGTPLNISRYAGTPPAGFTYATGGTLYYTLDGSDPRTAPDAVTETALIFGNSDACKWLVPSAGNGGFALTAGAGAQQWTTYSDPPNIANWTTGTTGIGYDTNPDYLPLLGTNGNTGAQMNGINATCYLRVTFTIPNQAALNNIGTLKLSMKYDDGFRAYINGVAVAGRNDLDPSMTSTPATAQANAIHDDALAVIFEDLDVTADGKPALRVGTNVLAVHCLNLPSASSDLLMIPKLTYLPLGASAGGRQVYAGPLALNASTTVRARLFSNNIWSPITNADFVVNAVPASTSNLVISEIMYNPSAATAAEITAGFGDNDFEYLELLNVGATNVDLTGCDFTTGVHFDFDLADPQTLTLAPGARLLVVANQAAFTMRYGASPGVKIAGTFSGSLSNAGELITLTALNGSIIASVTYGTAEPWPTAADGPGYSLVLNNPAADVNYGAAFNWRSSAQVGGTPGLANAVPFTGQPNGDSDGDGASDYFEYATGSNFNNPASKYLPVATIAPFTVQGVTLSYLKFSFRRNLAAEGVNFTPLYSTNLSAWAGDAAALTYVGTLNNGDGTATVTYRSTQPLDAAHSFMFVRLRVAP